MLQWHLDSTSFNPLMESLQAFRTINMSFFYSITNALIMKVMRARCLCIWFFLMTYHTNVTIWNFFFLFALFFTILRFYIWTLFLKIEGSITDPLISFNLVLFLTLFLWSFFILSDANQTKYNKNEEYKRE